MESELESESMFSGRSRSRCRLKVFDSAAPFLSAKPDFDNNAHEVIIHIFNCDVFYVVCAKFCGNIFVSLVTIANNVFQRSSVALGPNCEKWFGKSFRLECRLLINYTLWYSCE